MIHILRLELSHGEPWSHSTLKYSAATVIPEPVLFSSGSWKRGIWTSRDFAFLLFRFNTKFTPRSFVEAIFFIRLLNSKTCFHSCSARHWQAEQQGIKIQIKPLCTWMVYSISFLTWTHKMFRWVAPIYRFIVTWFCGSYILRSRFWEGASKKKLRQSTFLPTFLNLYQYLHISSCSYESKFIHNGCRT